MSSYDNRYNDIDDEPDFDYVNDDYGFDMDDDKEPSARTSTGASKNHKKKKASKPSAISALPKNFADALNFSSI